MKLKRLMQKLVVVAFAGAMSTAGLAADNVGFVYVSPIGDAGWTYQHDLGRLQVEKETGVTTSYVENVAEGPDAERVIREMAKRGDKTVKSATFFTTLTDFEDQGELGVFLDDDFVDAIAMQLEDDSDSVRFGAAAALASWRTRNSG